MLFNPQKSLPLVIGLAALVSLGACEQRPATSAATQHVNAASHVAPAAMQESEQTSAEMGPISIERRGETEARQGTQYRYQLVVTNTSDMPVHNVVVTEMLAEGLEIDQSDPPMRQAQQEQRRPQQQAQPQPQRQQQGQQQRDRQDQQQTTQQQQQQQPSARQPGQRQQQQQQQQQQRAQQAVSWHLGALWPGDSQVIDVYAVPVREGAFDSCVTVSYEPAICTRLYVTAPELQLTAEAPEAVYVCDEIPVTVRVTNAGSGTLEGGRVFVEAPQGLTGPGDEQQVAMELEQLEAGETQEHVIRMQPTEPGEYRFRASAETQAGQVQSEQVQVLVAQPELDIEVRGPQEAYLGQRATYEIVATNPSEYVVHNAVLSVEPPENVTRFSLGASGMEAQQNRVEIDQIDPGASRSIFMSFEGQRPGTFQTQVTAEGYCVEAEAVLMQAQFVGVPAVRISVIDRTDPVPLNETTVYEIRVDNQGSAPDMGIELTGRLSEHMEFISAEGASEVTAEGSQLRFGPVARLNPGEMVTWLVRARAVQPGSARLEMELVSDANQQPVMSSEPTTAIGSGQSRQGQQRQEQQDRR